MIILYHESCQNTRQKDTVCGIKFEAKCSVRLPPTMKPNQGGLIDQKGWKLWKLKLSIGIIWKLASVIQRQFYWLFDKRSQLKMSKKCYLLKTFSINFVVAFTFSSGQFFLEYFWKSEKTAFTGRDDGSRVKDWRYEIKSLSLIRKYNSLEESLRLNFFADFFLEASLGLEELASDLGFEVPPLNLKMKWKVC